MAKIQLLAFIKKPAFVLSLICLVFFLKGVFLAALYPFLHGQDEAKHYNTIQFITEPKEKTWPINDNIDGKIREVKNFGFFNFNVTEEIKETARVIDYGNTRKKAHNTQLFSRDYIGFGEEKIASGKWKRYNEDYPPGVVKKPHLYHFIAAQIEKIFTDKDILFRFYSIRIYSLILGSLCVFLSYFIFKNIGFSSKNSLMITAIIAFQPMFSLTSIFVNYDILLILSFTLFTLGAVMAVKNGLNIKSSVVLIGSIILGLLTKGTFIVLVPPLALLLFYLLFRESNRRKEFVKILILLVVITIVAGAILQNTYNIKNILHLERAGTIHGLYGSFAKYMEKSFSPGRISLSTHTYWGNAGWINENLSGIITKIIWAIEAIAAIGVVVFLLYPRRLEFLPEKKYVVLMIVMLAALQIGIHFFDWKVFQNLGSIQSGAPGRYFLPNIVPHFALVFVGVGALVRKKSYFDILLAVGLAAMLAFSLYSILDIIIPRFYL